ncbi:hypothetical protein O7626_05290 [Micromonospora sp. WMMD1102]|uniref:hypothetical protein n=1 Tax=Micromonospora sp. WMMD1102 TaxID=3016105 RepID=UPI002415521E|nr:hypothetical protein [Micromonospora sp. WMMD1102]MDG4785352.1 hypothetical protein [Micromonospora sp. WMMD1102]
MTGKPRGGDDGGGGDGNVPRQRGDSGGVPASVAKGQDQAWQRMQGGRAGGGGRGPGGGGDRGRQQFRAGDDVPGPARGRDLRVPHPRHTVAGSRNGEVKDPSTVYLRGYEDAARGDVEQIAAGNARWNPETQRYEVNGRSYGVESNGTVFPDSGDGVVKLDRNEYAALKEITRVGGDPAQSPQLQNNPRFLNNPEAVAKAKEIYDGTYEP